MYDKISAARTLAEAKFKKLDGSGGGTRLNAQKSEEQAVSDKTVRLKAMRLTKEEAERAARFKPPSD